MSILAFDVGTSSVKAAVLDVESGEPVGGVAAAAYQVEHPTPDAAELDPATVWNAIDAAAREAVASANAGAIDGVGFAGLMPALILLGADDKPIGPIWTHLDRRSRPVAKEVEAEHGDEFLSHCGNRPLPGGISAVCFAARLREDPGLADRVRSYLHLSGWIGLRLTGGKAIDPGNASFTGLWGTVTDQRWSRRWSEYFRVDPDWLPAVLPGDRELGGLRSGVAEAWGVKAGIPVKGGIADTSSAMLACGMSPGDVLHSVGTTQVLARQVQDPVPDPGRLTRHMGVGGGFVYVTHNPTGGVALDWIRELCFSEQDEETFFGTTIPAAIGRSTPVEFDPAMLGGDRLVIEERRAGFRNLAVSTQRDDLLAAVLDAMRAGHRDAVAALGFEGGNPGVVYLTGGGAGVVRQLLPEYADADVRMVRRGSLRGLAKLYRSPNPA